MYNVHVHVFTHVVHVHINASQYRSSSAFPSLSVGSIISVLLTGHDTVGAWNPGERESGDLFTYVHAF